MRQTFGCVTRRAIDTEPDRVEGYYRRMMTRREMFRNSAYAAALFGIPVSAQTPPASPLPGDNLLDHDPEAWWARLRGEQFLLPDSRVFLQNGSLGVAPRPVLNAVTGFLNRSAALDLEEYPRWGYETLDEHRAEVAGYLGCKKDELALMHN